jgi:hypothetical protein
MSYPITLNLNLAYFRCGPTSTFAEYYRKSDYIKGNNDFVPELYRIGRIVKFSTKQEGLDGSIVKVKLMLWN